MCEIRLLLSRERIGHNLDYIRSKLNEDTRILVNLKANAYGHGAVMLGKFLQDKVDYFSVACQKEGMELRQASIRTPILVYNPPVEWNKDFFKAGLEPVLYGLHQTEKLIQFIEHNRLGPVKVHVKLDTGMHRSGLMAPYVDEMIKLLSGSPNLELVSVLSHFAAADDPHEDAFTMAQVRLFDELSRKFYTVNPRLIRHIANSSAIFRLKNVLFDMVRPGLSVYGISPVEGEPEKHLLPIGKFITRITQIREVDPGETVGYNRMFRAERKTRVALAPAGYGDGYKRALGHGKGKVWINGVPAPVIGKVSMDMLTLDITGIEAAIGDEVVLFGDRPHVNELARWANTIPYDITTSLSQRVTRIWQNF